MQADQFPSITEADVFDALALLAEAEGDAPPERVPLNVRQKRKLVHSVRGHVRDMCSATRSGLDPDTDKPLAEAVEVHARLLDFVRRADRDHPGGPELTLADARIDLHEALNDPATTPLELRQLEAAVRLLESIGPEGGKGRK